MHQVLSPAEAVVQRQLEAYNARNLERLLASYAEEAEIYEHPATLLAKGKAELREKFQVRFQETNLHALLLQRIVSGSTVIDHERVTRTFPDGAGEIELIMIYDVRDGFIQRAWTIPGPRKLFGR